MQSNQLFDTIQESELEYTKDLYKIGILPGPHKCACNNEIFDIQLDNSNKTSKCCFRCKNSKCRNKFSIRCNSFYAKFPQIKLKIISQVIEFFICDEFNAEKAYEVLKEKYNISISKITLYKIYKEIRNVIYNFMLIVYCSEPIGETNGRGFYSVDESLFNHINDSQEWCLGIVNNQTKVFRIEAALYRSEETLKKFIFKFVPTGNTISSDGWAGYRFLDLGNSGYHHVITNHSFGNWLWHPIFITHRGSLEYLKI